jgi:hypothetical protein
MIRADILDPVTGIVIDGCNGADVEGYCPRQADDGRLPCAGHLLDAHADEVKWHLTMDVPSRATKCPVRGFTAPSR